MAEFVIDDLCAGNTLTVDLAEPVLLKRLARNSPDFSKQKRTGSNVAFAGIVTGPSDLDLWKDVVTEKRLTPRRETSVWETSNGMVESVLGTLIASLRNALPWLQSWIAKLVEHNFEIRAAVARDPVDLCLLLRSSYPNTIVARDTELKGVDSNRVVSDTSQLVPGSVFNPERSFLECSFGEIETQRLSAL